MSFDTTPIGVDVGYPFLLIILIINAMKDLQRPTVPPITDALYTLLQETFDDDGYPPREFADFFNRLLSHALETDSLNMWLEDEHRRSDFGYLLRRFNEFFSQMQEMNVAAVASDYHSQLNSWKIKKQKEGKN